MNSKANSGLLILIMIMSIFIGVVAGFLVSNGICNKKIADLEDELQFYYDEDDEEESEEYNRRRGEYGRPEKNEVANTTTKTNPNDITKGDVWVGGHTCTVDISKAKVGDVFDATLKPGFVVSFEITSKNGQGQNSYNSDFATEWKISINNKKSVYSDTYVNELDEIKFYFTDKYVLYSTYDGTDIRSEKLIIFDAEGNIVKEIYDLDEDNKGLVLSGIYCGDNSFTVEASRVSHGASIIADKYYKATPGDFNKEALEKLPADTTVKALYIYKIDSEGEIDFDNPQIVVTQTYKDFLKEFLEKSTDEYEDTIAVRQWLEKNK